MLLHTINKSPYDHRALRSCIQFCSAGDAIVLLEDGVYGVTHQDLQQSALEDIKLFAVQADLLARGLPDPQTERIQIITYDTFVALCVDYPRIKSW